MSHIKNIWREYIWDEIKETRDKYFVTYYPINLKNDKFAKLELVFTENIKIQDVANIMEKEFDIWISKFSLPLMVTSFDKKGDKISLKGIRTKDNLFGYIEKKSQNTVEFWDIISDDKFPKQQLTDENIKKIYKDLPYKNRVEKEKKRDLYIKEKRNIKRFLDITILLWLTVSFIIAFLGWQNIWIGAIAFIYSVYKMLNRWSKLNGNKSKKHREKQEKKRKMEHYYYHCERNPDLFRRLVADNFEKEEKERIQNEKENIKN